MISSKFLTVLFLLLMARIMVQGQSVSLFGVDSSFHNHKGKVHFSTILEHYESETLDKKIAIAQLGTEWSYYLYNKFSAVGNAYLFIPRGSRLHNYMEEDVKGFGGGGGGIFRWEFISFTNHNIYIETGFGMVFTTHSFPPKGTIWNFHQRYGFGINILLNKNSQLIMGWRHMHISNGKGLVPENPSFDGNGLVLGIKFIPKINK